MTDTPATPRISMTDIGSAIGKLHALQARLPPGERTVLDALLRAARVQETCPLQYNPYLPGVHTEPHPHYQRLRTENPIHYSEAVGAWVLTRYADVVAAFKDPRLSSRGNYEALMQKVPEPERDGVRTVGRFITATLNQQDPPDHTRLRRVMNRALSAGVLTQRRSLIQAIIDWLLDAVARRGEMDLVADLASPLALTVSVELLGVPEADRALVLEWTADVMHTFSDGFSGTEAMRRGERAVPALVSYFRPLVRLRRDSPGDDAISAMLTEDDATDEDVITLCIQFLMGVHETIRHTITVGLHALLLDQAQLTRLRADPDLILTAVEEMLRYDVISPIIQRTAREDLEIGGHRIRAGEQVILLLAAANRDPARFAAADALDLGRRPNPHIAFGAGIHICPGAGLARTTTVAALTALLARFPDLRLGGRPVWREEGNVRGLTFLPVAFTPLGAEFERGAGIAADAAS